MKIHEFQAKEVLRRYGVPTLKGIVATTPEEARRAFTDLGGPVAAVKAQIHAGGRGKAGGVKVVKSAADAEAFARQILGKPLVTPQTGPQGTVVRRVFVEQGCAIAREHYVGVTLDRTLSVPVMMACAEGGVEIEEVAKRSPEKILREAFDPLDGLRAFQARRLAFGLGLKGKTANSCASLLSALARAFRETDASIVEVNPLVITQTGEALALDAKMAFEENGLARHPELEELRDLAEEDATETEARKTGLSYVKLDGTIGCLVNGAGLAMATLDVIRQHGAWPANFLDVGGGASKEQVTAAFKLLLGDPRVKAVLVNIFGGIMSCAVIAEGILAALREVALKVPLVVRLEGNQVEEGQKLLAGSGLSVKTAASLDEGARLAVAAAGGGRA